VKKNIYHQLAEFKAKGKKQLAVLIDPDSVQSEKQLIHTCKLARKAKVDLMLIGGSLITNGFFDTCVKLVKKHSGLPVVLFPGNIMQVSKEADSILLLSLISGRNPDLLIGKHVLAAPVLKHSKLEIISTGYLIIDGGVQTSVGYMSNTQPIPSDKYAIAATTALAGEMLGNKLIYMDAGSGAQKPVSSKMIRAVANEITVPLFVGGGIRNSEAAVSACKAGADVVVVGNAFEQNPEMIEEICAAVHTTKR
jgi:putative glycerol-1-phosphate prenyltransferase